MTRFYFFRYSFLCVWGARYVSVSGCLRESGGYGDVVGLRPECVRVNKAFIGFTCSRGTLVF